MGKPEHHCDPKDPPYVAYTKPFVARTTTTTLPPVSNYIVYPNSGLSCPDLSYKSEIDKLGCAKLSGTPYEVLLTNNDDDCKGANFTVIDDQCSRGAIVQYLCCSDSSYKNILVSGDSTVLCLKEGGELRKIYGNITNIYFTSNCATTTTTTTY